MQLPFDACRRRRLYLLRHGQASAVDKDEGLYGDTIALTERGHREAAAMRDALAPVRFGEAYCSEIHRAQQTAGIVLEPHGIAPVATSRFTEIQGDMMPTLTADRPLRDRQAAMAYMMWTATDDTARFFGGEPFAAYLARTGETLSDIVRTTDSTNILIVSHSGFQRAALCWALDAVPLGIAKFEQDTCCLNILDVDVAPDGTIMRKHVRLANYTPIDPVKASSVLTDGEDLATRLFDRLDSLMTNAGTNPDNKES